ncbi:spore protease YyaC [Paenibacillaceae bacterium WGS1546]|uniref:spore protease YyaC n=1 Tax=Cohnella sp. WGS1546 TaxID=3366810 RepID=UPI00372D71E1
MNDRKPPEAEWANADGLRAFLGRIASAHSMDELVFLCIGTDRSTGDSLGPWVGTYLEERGMPGVIGTLRQPCDADALPRILGELPDRAVVLAIDACLGKPDGVGGYFVREGPLVPARSVNRGLGAVGAYSIAAVVNANSLKPYWTLQSTSLYRVIGMAKEVADAIASQWGTIR